MARTGIAPRPFLFGNTGMNRRYALLVASFGLLAPASADAQVLVRTWLPWRTIETEHFEIHYPVALEAWTRYLAARIEPIDSAVTRLVGYRLPTRTHIVVDNPYAVPNGSAWPFLKKPIINFWATPPDPREDIGTFRAWGEMLASHEFAHIVHLSRPSRNPLVRAIWQAMPIDVGPITLEAPRWVIEGYATYVEGKVTGSGRPHGAWRAAFLREWALEGQLPTYDQLNAWHAYAGGEFAYLAGSAYLEWLAAREGDSSLVHLWRRLSARQNRSFDEAFVGVFGESPRALYGRFTTEVTGKALDARNVIRGAGLDTGAIVQRLAWATGDPAISRDGSRVAVVVRSATRPGRVVIWKTAPEPDTSRAKRDSILLARDPEDVPARPIYPPPRKPIATLRDVGGYSYQQPRFMADGRVLVWRNTAHGDGSFAPLLYVWDPRRHHVKRIRGTEYVRDADPSPDGHTAAGMQCIHGWCDLVIADLERGGARMLARGNPVETWYRPRWSPDGTSIVAALHTGGVWRIAVVDAATGEYRFVDPADGANRYDATFLDADTVIVVSEASGVPALERIAVDDAGSTQLTAATGAAVAPEVNPADGSVWFLSLYSGGWDLRRLDSSATSGGTRTVVALDPRLAPAAPPARSQPTVFTPQSAGAPHRYSMGDRLFRWIPAPQYGADGASGVLALVSRDIVGRSEVLVQGAAGDPATWRGGAASLSARLHRYELRLSVFDASQYPTANRAHVPVPAALDEELRGGSLRLGQTLVSETARVGVRIGASLARDEHPSDAGVAPVYRRLGYIASSAGWNWRRDDWQLGVGGKLNRSYVRSADHWLRRDFGGLDLLLDAPLLPPVSAGYQIGSVAGAMPATEWFSLGGMPSPLVDADILTQRVTMPVLPTGVATGDDLLTYRLSIPGALSPYLWAGGFEHESAVFTDGVPTGTRTRYDWHRVIGVDATLAVPAIPLAGTPAARARFGVGESLDAPLRHRVQAYITLVFDP